jgi:hypothetical protein
VTVLQEILEWSTDRPAWQRDALRRLVLDGELSDTDIEELTEICKSGYGLAEARGSAPLLREHVPEKAVATAAVSLVSIFHHRGVNALAEDQTLKFNGGLTVVYGDNGAGKTGYIRILKTACRARWQELILGNVASGVAPLAPVVAIKYKVGSEDEPRQWTGTGHDEAVSRVSVFDTHCAAVYLTEKTDVAFRPFGLDLFDKLVKACRLVRSRLEMEQRAQSTNALPAVLTQIPGDTVVGKFLANLSSLTSPAAVTALSRPSAEEETRLAFLERSLLDLQANDPEKLIRQLTVRAGRIRALAVHLKNVESTLSPEAVAAVFDARAEGRRKGEQAKRLRETTFTAGLLDGTGSDSWASLWEAARQYSTEQAYANKDFPVIDDGSRCVLCQQHIDVEAARRLKQFEAFVVSTTERELRSIRANFAQARKAFVDLKTMTESVDETLREIAIEHEGISTAISAALADNADRRNAVVAALHEDRDIATDCPDLASVSLTAQRIADETEARIKTLRTSVNDHTRQRLTAEAQELRARTRLGLIEKTVLEEIERRKKVAAYGVCIDETKTRAITQMSTAVTKTAVTQKLKESFGKELSNLDFRDVEVELAEVGGADGVFYHKLVLTRAPGIELPKVASEGEQRCLSIAAFFAELSTADDPSGIVFDDPVSSLDFRWRLSVARRLVQESKTRQVVVFTHDVVFLLALKRFAEKMGVEPLDQHVRHLSTGAGVCVDELPWVALGIKKKIGFLKNAWQSADKVYRLGQQDAYDKEAKHLYGLLREAWERAIEEVLLGSVVERFRANIETKQIGQLADVTDADCKAVETAMTKCSSWLHGHDQAAAARAPVPDPAELKADIDELENWVKAIHKRRQ